MNCNSCGSSNLIDGTIVNSDGGHTSVFVPNDRPYLKKIFGIGGSKVLAHVCVHCNNLQFTVDFSEEDKARYVEFEGKQPGILERINEEENLPD